MTTIYVSIFAKTSAAVKLKQLEIRGVTIKFPGIPVSMTHLVTNEQQLSRDMLQNVCGYALCVGEAMVRVTKACGFAPVEDLGIFGLMIESRNKTIILFMTCSLSGSVHKKKNPLKLDHPPYSPNVAPCEFWLFPKKKKTEDRF